MYLYDYKDAATADVDALKRIELVDYQSGDDFHSLGMTYDEPTSTLYVANNRHDGPRVDLFRLDMKALQAKHIRSIRHDLIHGPNAIVLKNSHEFFVTNDHYFLMAKSRFLSQLETYLAFPLGTVVHVDIADPDVVKASIVARLPFANGIEMINGTTLAVASSNKAQVQLYTVDSNNEAGSSPSLTYHSAIKAPFHVDNLSLSADGRLLLAGHPHMPSLTKFAKTRFICNNPDELLDADEATQEYCKTGQTGSWVSEWTEHGGLKHLYVDTEYPTSATAVYDSGRNVGIVAGLYAKGVLVWRD